MANPVLVEITRGPMIESQHRGTYAVCKASGEVIESGGDITQLIYPRSAVKPLQALPVIETGAADHFRLDQKRLSLCCASHNAESAHVQEVRHWLSHIEAPEEALCCAGHYANLPAISRQQAMAGVSLRPALNNCSGKHTGFLTTARYMGEELAGYEQADHPVQRRLRAVLSEMGESDLTDAPYGIDGCGIPVLGMALKALAVAFAKMADPSGLGARRQAAVQRIRDAVAAEPFYIAGSGRFCTEVMKVTGKRALIKVGAEGVYCGALPERGLGIALKIDDGAARGAERVMAVLLEKYGAVTAAEADGLSAFFRPKITNMAGEIVGDSRATLQ